MSGAARIGYVLEGYPRPSETFVVNEILAAEALGAQLVVFRLRPPEQADPHGAAARVAAPVLDVPGEGDDAQARALAALVREYGVDHLHAHFANTATTVARPAARQAGITYSFTAHAMDIFSPVADAADLAEKMRDAAFTVTVSDFNLAHLRTIDPDARLTRVYNGIDLDRFPFRPRVSHDGPARILAVGRLVEKKGFAVLVDAVDLLRRRGLPVRLDIVGAGPLDAALGARAAASVDPAAIRLIGARSQREVAELMAGADVVVVPSVVAADGDAEGLPTVLIEAMASGAPVVATAVTGIPELVRDNDTGSLVAPGDPRALADAIAATLSAPAAERDAMLRRARERIERDFDARRQAARLLALTASRG
jgi:glycosyltransferase involved in cell wall biosynthesis